jgi:hypothetical protein
MKIRPDGPLKKPLNHVHFWHLGPRERRGDFGALAIPEEGFGGDFPNLA